jgi:3-oxoacyl-[acyl-carrier-protein] synthase III
MPSRRSPHHSPDPLQSDFATMFVAPESSVTMPVVGRPTITRTSNSSVPGSGRYLGIDRCDRAQATDMAKVSMSLHDVTSEPNTLAVEPGAPILRLRDGIPRRGAQILALGTHRPAKCVDNMAIAERLGSSDEWIRERSGIQTRGVAGTDETVVAMAASAGAEALESAGIAGADVDLLLLASCTLKEPYGVPAATAVAAVVGATSAFCVDLGAACAGFTYGLALAADAIRSGAAEHVLVIGSEKFSDIVDPYDRSAAFLFGDGAGAGVVGPSDVERMSRPTWLSDGAQAHVLTTTGTPPVLYMDGPAVYRWAIATVPKLAIETSERAGVPLKDLDAVVPHQANLRIIDSSMRKLDLSPTVVIARDIVHSGNTSAASIPLAMARLMEDRQITQGDLVMLLGFGAGLTASGLVVHCP